MSKLNENVSKISIGSDHGGFALKSSIIAHLEEAGITVTDRGCYDTSSCDYPVFAKAVGADVADGSSDLGILICSTGIGMSMAANKVPGVRAALCHESYSAKMTKLHNNANVLCLGALVTGENLALDIVDTFISTPFSEEERHIRRVNLIEN